MEFQSESGSIVPRIPVALGRGGQETASRTIWRQVSDPRARPTTAVCPEAHAAALRGASIAHPTLGRQFVVNLQRSHGNAYTRQVLRIAGQGHGEADAGREVESRIERSKGGGHSLDSQVQGKMESAFGANFGGVRVHTDSEADSLNRSLEARAFTTGQDIYFRQGEYRPESSHGRELLAHELTHVVQQNGAGVQFQLMVSQPGDAEEVEAEHVAKKVTHHLDSKPPKAGQSEVAAPPGESHSAPERDGATAEVLHRSVDPPVVIARSGAGGCSCGGAKHTAGECPECQAKRLWNQGAGSDETQRTVLAQTGAANPGGGRSTGEDTVHRAVAPDPHNSGARNPVDQAAPNGEADEIGTAPVCGGCEASFSGSKSPGPAAAPESQTEKLQRQVTRAPAPGVRLGTAFVIPTSFRRFYLGTANPPFAAFTKPKYGLQDGRIAMDQDRGASWVDRDQVTADGQRSGATKRTVTACQAAFDKGQSFFRWKPGQKCPAQDALASPKQANSKVECESAIGAGLDTDGVAAAKLLLRHEQYHVDLACDIATDGNRRIDSGAAAAGILNAVKMADHTNQAAYDNDTGHGCNAGQQAGWEQRIDTPAAGWLP